MGRKQRLKEMLKRKKATDPMRFVQFKATVVNQFLLRTSLVDQRAESCVILDSMDHTFLNGITTQDVRLSVAAYKAILYKHGVL